MGCSCWGYMDSQHADCSDPPQISEHADCSDPLQISEHAEYLPALGPRMGESIRAPRLVGKTAQAIFQEVSNRLNQNHTVPICVYGIAGAGKTAIMMNVYNQLLEAQDNGFHNIIFFSVRRYSENETENIRKWQDSLAYAINLDLPQEGDVHDRDEILHKVVKEIRNCVIIMDDVSVGFDMSAVGIHVWGRSHQVVLITRFEYWVHNDSTFIWVDLLSEKEARELFIEKAAIELIPQTKDVINQFVKECASLPLIIVAVAKALRGKNDIFWKKFLDKLRYSATGMMDAQLYKSLKSDWDKLHHHTHRIPKKRFLYCALYPKHWKISKKELIDYWHIVLIVYAADLGEILVKGNDRYEPRRDFSFEDISFDFDDCHEWGGGLKMNPLYRDFALLNASHQYMSKCGLQLTELPDKSEWGEELEGASFMCNDIRSISVRPICPKLSTLFLNKNPKLCNIAHRFFVHMLGLKILDLRDNAELKSLPDSLSDLWSLEVLRLSRCSNLKKVPSLKDLMAMKILELDETGIEELPIGIDMYFTIPESTLKVLKLHSLKLRHPMPSWFLELLPLLPQLDLEI